MHVSLYSFLFFPVYISIFSGFALQKTSTISVLTITTNTVAVLEVTAIMTETDVMIASPIMLTSLTRLSTPVNKAVMNHVTSAFSLTTQGLPSIEPSMPIGRTDTVHTTQKSPPDSSSGSSVPLSTTQTTQMKIKSLHSVGSSPSSSTSCRSTPIDTAATTQIASSSYYSNKSAPSSFPSHVPTTSAVTNPSISISSGLTQSLLSSPLNNLPINTVIPTQMNPTPSFPTQNSLSSLSKHRPDSTTVEWITKSALVPPSTTTTTITYRPDGSEITSSHRVTSHSC